MKIFFSELNQSFAGSDVFRIKVSCPIRLWGYLIGSGVDGGEFWVDDGGFPNLGVPVVRVLFSVRVD